MLAFRPEDIDDGIGAATMHITSISTRTVMNSLARPTPEFVVTLEDGSCGWASTPEGETRGRWEDGSSVAGSLGPGVAAMQEDPAFRLASDQAAVDAYLAGCEPRIPRNAALGISIAYLRASAQARRISPVVALRELGDVEAASRPFRPILLVNILNGGAHARTNPVLSDFPEFLLVPRSLGLDEIIAAFHEVDRHVKSHLAGLERRNVRGAVVHIASNNDNRAWIELLLDVLTRLDMEDEFGLMIDASAGDLQDGDTYHFSRTVGSRLERGQMVEYWLQLCADYPLEMIEDPFGEDDLTSWAALNAATPDVLLVGDNLCNTDADRIRMAARQQMIGATLIKPNQAGTVTDTLAAVRAARRVGVRPIPSHRSIETDVPWLADLAIALGLEMMKLGLISDFATIQKLNRILRYGEGWTPAAT